MSLLSTSIFDDFIKHLDSGNSKELYNDFRIIQQNVDEDYFKYKRLKKIDYVDEECMFDAYLIFYKVMIKNYDIKVGYDFPNCKQKILESFNNYLRHIPTDFDSVVSKYDEKLDIICPKENDNEWEDWGP